MKNIFFFFLIFCFISCATNKKTEIIKEEKKEEIKIEEKIAEPIVQEEEVIEVQIMEPINEIEEEIEIELIIPETEKLPPHPAVEEAINFYTTFYFEQYQNALTRFSYYKKEMSRIFIEEGVPEELIYMTLTESLFNPKAKSRKGAYGVWQFISSTGKLYGLKIDSFIDERADCIKATKAAAKYLKESYNIFNGDVLLTIASYNCGIGNVLKAQKRCQKNDFWDIRKCLPKETRNFVPSVLASIEIGKNPAKYNFDFEERDMPSYTELNIPYSVNLKKLVNNTNISVEMIKELNPELRSFYTPPYNYNLKLTDEIKNEIISNLPYHITEEGETLLDLEKKYKVKKELIAKINKLKLDEVFESGRAIFIPEDTYEDYHIVQIGENPYTISKKYGVSLEKFLEINGLNKKSIIHPGQKLRVPGGYVSKIKTYKVKKGDNLAKIAKKFSTTIEKIMETNGLKSHDISPGLILQIECDI